MAKTYPSEPDKTTGTDKGDPVRKTFGVYDRPAGTSRGVIIGSIIAAVIFLIVVAYMLLD